MEMIARLAALAAASGDPLPVQHSIIEYPLEKWEDVAGSKVKSTDILRMAYGLCR